jgi:hypothetical protein
MVAQYSKLKEENGMITGIPHELWAVAGLGVIGYIGNSVLLQVGQKALSDIWSIILTVAGSIIGVKFFIDGTKAIGTIIQIHW